MRIFYLFIFCIAAGTATGQANNFKVSGTIKDEQLRPLQSGAISLLRIKDSSLVKLAVSDKAGTYELVNVKPGKYIVSAALVGYSKSFSKLFEVSNSNTEVPEILLKQNIKQIGEVTVQAKKPFIETKIDKTIVNVDASPTSAGSTALEVLEKSPGISVSNDGVISLRGKSGVIVMLDGKPTYLSAADLANMLKNMPASALDQIEIMTNPSSKYDAEGNSGVINIKTKKGKTAGFNGSIMVGYTSSIYRMKGTTYFVPKSQNSFNFNYKKNKINIFGNYNPNIFRGRNELTIDRNFYNNGVLDGSSTQNTEFKFGNTNHTLKLGLDYYANKKNVFGIVLNGFVFNGHPTPITNSIIKDKNGMPQSAMISKTENRIGFENFSGNLNWKHSFDTAGRELTVDFDYVTYSNVSNMLLTTNFYNNLQQQTSPTLYLSGHLPADINIYSFKTDYSHPFRNGRLEAGIKSSYVKNDNLVDYKRQSYDKWINDTRSNHFVYDENINAAYVNINKQIKKWTVQGGLRLENTIAKGYQVTNDSSFKRNFTNLFPSLFLSYAASKNNQFTISYTRRVTRPNYQDLNPFTYFLDSLTYRVGNPYLLPQFTHNFELSYAYKSKFIFTLNYNNTNDVISQILKQNTQSKITYNTSENVANFKNMGLSITAPASFAKWWNANFFTNVYNNHYKGMYNNQPIDMNYTSFMINLTNSFTLGKGLTGELTGFYRYKGVDQLSVNEPVYQLSVGAQKQVMKGKGTVRLNVRDPFAWQKFEGRTKYSDIDVRFLARPDVRQVTATFTYRFGKNTPGNQPRRRQNASQDEQNRIGQGGN
ncbi:MAG: hypothetical protein JWN76_3776 [Chitinophagaceae bacterium]|nr:hypothetical protein [Chitinophagaceae bacterium]